MILRTATIIVSFNPPRRTCGGETAQYAALVMGAIGFNPPRRTCGGETWSHRRVELLFQVSIRPAARAAGKHSVVDVDGIHFMFQSAPPHVRRGNCSWSASRPRRSSFNPPRRTCGGETWTATT